MISEILGQYETISGGSRMGVSLSAEQVLRQVSSPYSFIVTNKDRQDIHDSAGQFVSDYALTVSKVGGDFEEPITLVSSNPAVGRIAGKDAFYVADGTIEVTAAAPASNGAVSKVTLAMAKTEPITIRRGFVRMTMGWHIARVIDARILGKNAATAKPIFSSQDFVNKVWVRNVNCWAYGLDITCLSPWNSIGANQRAGTVVGQSRQYVLFAAHFPLEIGSQIAFVTQDNQTVLRTVSDRRLHPDFGGVTPDVGIAKLDSPLPASIRAAKILPYPFNMKAPTGITYMPAMVLDQEENALIADGLSYTDLGFGFTAPVDAKRLEFYEDVIVGDSGNPALWFFPDASGFMQTIILTMWTFGGAGSGINVAAYKADIDSMIASMGGTDTLQIADVSRFRTFTI